MIENPVGLDYDFGVDTAVSNRRGNRHTGAQAPSMAGGARQGSPLASRQVLVFHPRIACRPSVERDRQAQQLGACHEPHPHHQARTVPS